MPAGSLLEAGRVKGFQVVPPSVVEITDLPVPDTTVAKQSALLGHATSPTALGTLCALQVVPPFVVTTMTPVLSKLSYPTATQSEVVGQEMPVRRELSPGTLCTLQLAPPSVVTSMTGAVPSGSEPVAKQSDVVGQAMASRLSWGRFWLVHELPPSVVVSTAPP
jgi:hypothetical protein